MAAHKQVEGKIKEKMVILDILKVCPEAEEVFKKHWGPYCLDIPGSKTETVEFLSAMNDYHVGPVLEDLNKVCKDSPVPEKVGHF